VQRARLEWISLVAVLLLSEGKLKKSDEAATHVRDTAEAMFLFHARFAGYMRA
jgi:hypothetical protein